jgi:hypothetical protein
MGWLASAPVAGRLELLRLENFGGRLDRWATVAHESHPALGELVLSYWGVSRFRRGPRGLEVEVDARGLTTHQRSVIDTALARVPAGVLSSVKIER